MELWEKIEGFNGLYEISTLGRIKSIRKNKYLHLNNNGKGYKQVTLSLYGQRKTLYVHRLVAIAFIPNPHNLPEVNHKDGNKSNNDIFNLEWCSRLENIQHSELNNFRIPKGAIGERNTKSKLTENKVKDIYNLLSKNIYTQEEIAKKYNVNRSQISCIKRGITWKHLNLINNDTYNIRNS